MDSMEQAQTIDTYSPSGRLSLLSIPTMLALGGAFGIGAAFIVHLISDWTGFYLIFLFPAGIGFAAGFGLRLGIKAGKCRNPWVGMAAGLLVGAASYILMHYFDSVTYGASGLTSYVSEIADLGYQIFFIPVSGPFAWLSWIVELGVAVFFAVTIAGGSTSEPYCEGCDPGVAKVRYSTRRTDR